MSSRSSSTKKEKKKPQRRNATYQGRKNEQQGSLFQVIERAQNLLCDANGPQGREVEDQMQDFYVGYLGGESPPQLVVGDDAVVAHPDVGVPGMTIVYESKDGDDENG